MTSGLGPVFAKSVSFRNCHTVVVATAPQASRLQTAESSQRKLRFLYFITLALPSLAHAAAVDLRTATESGNAIIMYLSGTFAAVGIVAAGVAMMMGRQSIAKWAFAGAMVSGLAFAIVKTMWGNMGLEASGVSSFSP